MVVVSNGNSVPVDEVGVVTGIHGAMVHSGGSDASVGTAIAVDVDGVTVDGAGVVVVLANGDSVTVDEVGVVTGISGDMIHSGGDASVGTVAAVDDDGVTVGTSSSGI